METNTTEMNKKNNKKKIAIIIILILLLIAGITCCHNYYDISQYEAVDEIKELNLEERQAAVNQLVDEGMMNVQYGQHVIFNGKVSEDFLIKNIDNNHGDIQFVIYDEEMNVIYESKRIPTGYKLNSIELDKELPKGTHNCTIQIGYADAGNVSSAFPLIIEVR